MVAVNQYYQNPLASVHDQGFLQYAESAAEMVIQSLASRGIERGHVIDLGCGTGRLAEIVSAAGHRLTGLDISPGMIELARHRAPQAEIIEISFHDFDFPDCDCVTAVGEIFNYRFEEQARNTGPGPVFDRIFRALRSGGLFLFDAATPGRLGGQATRLQHFETPDWSLVVDSREDDDQLQRRCLIFLRDGDHWQRHEETHRLELSNADQLVDQLQSCGFEVDVDTCYGPVNLPAGMLRIRAVKP